MNFNEIEHREEIRQSRVGGFGGSDAALFLRIANNGIENLSVTDRKRIAVAMGIEEVPNWGGNKYTEAGHAFEDYMEDAMPHAMKRTWDREVKLQKELTKEFTTFAHADFVTIEGNATAVLECKFSQKKTAEVECDYKAQLQWYYLMGATRVALAHGWGSVEPFHVEDLEFVKIDRDEEIITTLQAGVEALAQALRTGWMPEYGDVVDEYGDVVDDVIPQDVADRIEKLRNIKTYKTKLDEEEKAAKEYIADYMQTDRHATLRGSGFVISHVEPKVGTSFDSKAFKKDHPELYAKYMKQTTTKGYLSVTFKDI